MCMYWFASRRFYQIMIESIDIPNSLSYGHCLYALVDNYILSISLWLRLSVPTQNFSFNANKLKFCFKSMFKNLKNIQLFCLTAS